MLSRLFTYLFDRYTGWELVNTNIPHIINKDGVQDIFIADQYRRFNKIYNTPEFKSVEVYRERYNEFMQ